MQQLCWYFILCLFLPFCSAAQYPYYNHFTIHEGLISNKVYNLIEDRQGFIWISTDQGVSRYDGISFTNFVSGDGLPDNEVLGLFEDDKGRIWFNGFTTEPCYYFNGKIYNSGNDPFLKRVKEHKPPGACNLVVVQHNNSVAVYIEEYGKKLLIGKEIPDIEIPEGIVHFNFYQGIFYMHNDRYSFITIMGISSWRKGETITYMPFSDGRISMHYTKAPEKYVYGLNVRQHLIYRLNLLTGDTAYFAVDKRYSKLFHVGELHILADDSAYTFYDATFTRVLKSARLPFAIERTYIDRKGNAWFGSFDKGIYMMRKNSPVKIDLPGALTNGIIGIEPFKNELLLRTEANGLLSVNESGVCKTRFIGSKRILGCAYHRSRHVIGADNGLYILDQAFDHPRLMRRYAVKDMEPGGINETLISTAANGYIYRYNPKDTLITVYYGRTTAMCRHDDSTIWLGGLTGIYKNIRSDTGFVTRKMVLHPYLDNSRVVDIKKDKLGNMWIATYQNGAFLCTSKGHVIRLNETAEKRSRLLSDACLQISVLDDGSVWIATVNGISVIHYHSIYKRLFFSISNYSLPDGLPDKTITGITYWKNKIWVATPNGLFYFSSFPQPSKETGQITFTEVSVNSTAHDYQPELIMPYDQNNFIIAYASSFINTGVSYAFKYRVKELNDAWIENNSLQVPLLGLKPGTYTFEVAALNVHREPGKVASFSFVIRPPWFRQGWFMLLLFVLLTGGLLYVLNREKKRIALSRDLSQMELKVLRAQMNPHFIFNSLNAIQHFLMKRDFTITNQYIANFAKMIRSSLHFSSVEAITLAEERQFLENYLLLEKLRFQQLFEYEVKVLIADDFTRIPTFMIQPLLENSIKHAFKQMKQGGLIHILFSEVSDKLIKVEVTDNGTGLPLDFRITGSSKADDSIGLSILVQRISLLRIRYKSQLISFTIKNGINGGTHATLILPIIKP